MTKPDYLKTYRRETILALLLLATMLIGLQPQWVESLYATGLYTWVSITLRFVFGKIPFSIGDIFYGIAFIIMLTTAIRFFVRLFAGKVKRNWIIIKVRRLLRIVMVVYLVFQWMWGLNYHRLGSAYQLHIEPSEYNGQELFRLADTLNSRLVELVPAITIADSAEWQRFETVSQRCIYEYGQTAKTYPFVAYKMPSVKNMLISSIGGYGGFSGYLNPFTGEAQLNEHMPPFLRAYVTCHEIGHQLGYAAEEEANMVGYLVARQSANPAVRYSVYHDLFMYACSELYAADSAAYTSLYQQTPLLVKQHAQQAKAYYQSFKNPLQPLINKWYDLYLKANSQAKGVHSYSYVTAWLIAYARKYGWSSI